MLLKYITCITTITLLIIQYNTVTTATPFPVKGNIYNAVNELTALAHVYPRYVEISDLEGKKIGRVGIMVEEGIAKLFLVKQDKRHSLIGYSGPSDHPNKGTLYNVSDKIAGYYFWTPTWSFIFNNQNKRVGKVKCIAWPRVCAAGVGGYLLNFFNQNQALQKK
ncbi:MAG: hypothetical protein HOD92_10745 [Deltaproteobacteria bacterium]|jgi:hypothetical protein|nr:hypothetical protein [Deltaproteobacteria bacterium]MBT4525379.1 hypothetical protein [Deltaproteobacteria bacterium]